MKYGRYQIQKELGRGAMGIVFQAHDPKIDRIVALKVLRQDRVAGEEFTQRFLKEAIAAGRLSHPNIVTVYDVGYDHDTVYIAMEFLDGQPLNEVFKEQSLDIRKIVDIGAQIADSLAYAHEQGVVHRDIKPSNIIITRDGRVKITDFGVARIEDPSATQLTQAGEIIGTPNYMSVEQVKGQPVDGRSDLFSLGVILYELSTGQRPFAGENMPAVFNAIITEEPKPPMEIEHYIYRGLPALLSEVIIKSLSKKPEKRFQDGRSMAAALKSCIGGGPPIRSSASPVSRRKRGQIGILISVASVLLAIFIILYLQNSGKNIDESDRILPSFLNVKSTPEGAQLYVNGSLKGQTPLRLELPLGKYEVRLNLPDYYEWEAQLKLEEGGEVPLNIRLMPMNQK